MSRKLHAERLCCSLRLMSKLLILVEGKHVHHMTFAVDQQHPPAVDHPLQIAGKLGQLIFTSQGQGLGRFWISEDKIPPR